MFEIYRAALLEIGRLGGVGNFLRQASAMQGCSFMDRMTEVNKLIRQNAPDEHTDNEQHGEANHQRQRTEDQEKYAHRPRHAMPEEWCTWPLRQARVLDCADALGKPLVNTKKD